jgi:hypothetical protein
MKEDIESIFSYFQSLFGFSLCKKNSKYSSVNFKFTARYFSFVSTSKLVSISNEWKESLDRYFPIFRAYLDSINAKRTLNILH